MNAALIGCAALGGGVGAALRYAVDTAVTERWRGTFPLGIFLVNVTGALALGLLVGIMTPGGAAPGGADGAGPELLFAILGTGVLGGYTTFSTASLDMVRLARSRQRGTALAYAVGTLVMSATAALAGMALGAAAS